MSGVKNVLQQRHLRRPDLSFIKRQTGRKLSRSINHKPHRQEHGDGKKDSVRNPEENHREEDGISNRQPSATFIPTVTISTKIRQSEVHPLFEVLHHRGPELGECELGAAVSFGGAVRQTR
jgi:hypothetical protein